ncbi:MAG: long-chain fatty acid--CoA ligase, partial [Acidovorax sp.]|nr:long-chain fatty acid--CoA ligase [Acidovorax sp.]
MSPTPTDIDGVRTLPQLLAFRAAATPNAEAYRAFDSDAQAWTSLTWAATAQRVAEWARALAALQL